MQMTRRKFIKALGSAGMAFILMPYKFHGAHAASEFFDEDQLQILSHVVNSIFPHACRLGVLIFIENLLTAFECNPPRIYAGGPFSGRRPYSKNGRPTNEFPVNEFQNFLPLTRVQEQAWKLYLYGSDGVPGGGPNDDVLGPITGLRDLMSDGLNFLSYFPIQYLPNFVIRLLVRFTGSAFEDATINLTMQAILSSPEYGGNQSLAGWRMIHFEGDTQPLGYTLYDETIGDYRERPEAPVSRLDATEDPHPLSATTHAVLTALTQVRQGRKFY